MKRQDENIFTTVCKTVSAIVSGYIFYTREILSRIFLYVRYKQRKNKWYKCFPVGFRLFLCAVRKVHFTKTKKTAKVELFLFAIFGLKILGFLVNRGFAFRKRSELGKSINVNYLEVFIDEITATFF